MSREMTELQEALVVRRTAEEPVDDHLDAVVFAPALQTMLSASEKRSLYGEAMAPIWRLIEDDPVATSAAKKLSERMKSDIDAVKPHDYVRSAGSSWSFDIPSGTSIFTPPYDYARPGPTQGSTVEVNPDPVAGTISVDIHGDWEYDGAFAGSAAVGLGIEFQNRGLASVRPYVEYQADLNAFGSSLSSTVEGRLGFLVTAEDGTLVSTTQDYLAAHFDSDNQFSEDGVLRQPYQEVRFLADAHRPYRVWLWATVAGDQSGHHTFGGSFAGGTITADVKFVTVEIH